MDDMSNNEVGKMQTWKMQTPFVEDANVNNYEHSYVEHYGHGV